MNWQQIIADLKAYGVTQLQMAVECGCKQSTINELSKGRIANPSFPIGQGLVRMVKAKKRELDRLNALRTPATAASA